MPAFSGWPAPAMPKVAAVVPEEVPEEQKGIRERFRVRLVVAAWAASRVFRPLSAEHVRLLGQDEVVEGLEAEEPSQVATHLACGQPCVFVRYAYWASSRFCHEL